MVIISNKTLTFGEKKWSYMQIPSKKVSEFPEKFNLHYNDKIFPVFINKANRIVSTKLFSELGLHMGDIVTIEKKDGIYSITFKQGTKRYIKVDPN